MKKGSKVTYSEVYLKDVTPSADPNKKGIIIQESRDGRCWAVLWEGRKKAINYHKSFLKEIE